MSFMNRLRCTSPTTISVPSIPVYFNGSVWDSRTQSKVAPSVDLMEDVHAAEPPPWPFRPCRSEKWSVVYKGDGILPYATLGCDPGNGGVCRMRNLCYVYTPQTWDELRLAIPPLAQIKDFLFEARSLFLQCCELIDSPTDLLVFLIELGDIAELARFLLKKLDFLGKLFLSNPMFSEHGVVDPLVRLGEKLMLKASKTRGGYLRLLVKEASEDLLTYAFAWKPLVSDLEKIYNRINDFWTRYESLTLNEGKLLKRTRSKNLTVTVPNYFSSNWDNLCYRRKGTQTCGLNTGPTAFYGDRYYNRSWTSPKLSVTIAYRYSLPDDWNSIIGQLGYALSALGLKPGLGTIWELIPFSFVVDWFIPVGKLLEPFHADASGIKTEIVDVCATLKSGRDVVRQHRRACETSNNAIDFMEIQRTDFERIAGEEFTSSLPSFHLPTGFQLLLGAALLGAQ